MDLLIIVIITVVVETKKCMQVLEEVASTEVSTKATKKKNTACISAGAFSSLLVMLHLDQTTKKIFMGPWQWHRKKKKKKKTAGGCNFSFHCQ